MPFDPPSSSGYDPRLLTELRRSRRINIALLVVAVASLAALVVELLAR